MSLLNAYRRPAEDRATEQPEEANKQEQAVEVAATGADTPEGAVIATKDAADADGSSDSTRPGETLSAEPEDLDVDLDIDTAAGPGQAASPPSGGSGEYSDDMGELLSGLDRLGSLGTDFWSRQGEVREVLPSRLEAPPDTGPQQEGPERPPQPPGPASDYNARAVIYAQDPAQDNSVTTQYLNSKGQPVQGEPVLDFVDGDDAAYITWSYDGNGNLVFTLTDAGKDFLADGASPDYIEILYRVTDRVTGESYIIQIVIPRDKYFSAEDFAQNGSRYAGPVGDEDLIHGEWHEGQSFGDRDYLSTSSNLDDSYVLNGVYEDTDIRTGYGDGHWGNDTITIKGDIDNIGGTVNIVTGTGIDSVSLYAMYASQGGTSVIDTGRDKGDRVDMTWKMQADGTHNAAGATSSNTIITGDLNIASQTNYGMYAVNTNQGKNPGGNSAQNIVDASGNVLISVSQFSGHEASAMRADNQSQNSGRVSNSIKADGDVTLLVNKPVDGATTVSGMSAETWCATDHGTASNSIEAGGKVTIDVKGGKGADVYGMFAINEGANSVKAGSIDIDVSGTGYVAGVQSSAKDSTTGNNYWTTGGRNTLDASNISIKAESSGGEAHAVVTGKHGETIINGVKDQKNTFEFEAKGTSAYGVSSVDHGDLPISSHGTRITGGDENDSITIRAYGQGTSKSDGYAMGMYSGSTGHNRIDTGAGFDAVTVEARGTNNSIGMSAGSNKQGGSGWGGTDASNAIENAEKVSVLGESGGGNAYGIFANAGQLPKEYTDKLGDYYETGFNKIILGSDGDGNRELDITARATGTGADAGNAYGMWAYNQQASHHWGFNQIEGSKNHGNTINIEAESRGGQAWGMMAQGPSSNGHRGGNHIMGGDQADSITIKATGATQAIGMQAGKSAGLSGSPAVNEIDSGRGKDTISVIAESTGEGSSATGMLAYSGGQNSLTAKEGKVGVTVTSKGGDATGMQASGTDSSNTINASEVDIKATATGNGNAYGVLSKNTDRAYSSGDNTIESSDVKINATAEGSGAAYGMLSHLEADSYSWSETGTNTVRAASIDVSAKGNAYAAGIQSSLRTFTDKASSQGGGTNILEGASIKVSAESTDGTAIGAATGRDGETVLKGSSITVNAGSDNSKAYGLYAIDKGKTTVEGSNVLISASSGAGAAHAVEAGMNGLIEIKGSENGNNTLTFEAKGASAYGISSYDLDGGGQGSGSPYGVTITGGNGNDTVTIRATADGNDAGKNGFAMGMYSGSTGQNVIDTGKGVDTVIVEAKGTNNSFGMAAGSMKNGGMGGSEAANTIRNAEKVTILGESKNGDGYGMFASPGTSSRDIFNRITLGDDGEGDRELTVTGRALGAGNAYGMAARSFVSNVRPENIQGQNIIQGSKAHGNKILVEAESLAGGACGMIAYGSSTSGTGYGGANRILGGDKADSITVAATGATMAVGMQAGMDGKHTPALNQINSGLGSDTVTISASATVDNGMAAGMLAYKGAQNTVTSVEGTVNLNVSANGEAIGMSAKGTNASNTVTASEVNLDINSTGGTAYGMLAQSGGVNTIRASGDGGFTVILKVAAGSANNAYAMYATGGGKNQIIGSGEGDLVDITGRIAGNNLIDTGGGDDTVSLNGKVDTSLVIKAGSGYDLLILKATDSQAFTENYKAWLESMSDSQLREMEIQEIWVNGEAGAGWMNDSSMDWFWKFVDRYNDVTGNNVCPDHAPTGYDLDAAWLLDRDGLDEEDAPDAGILAADTLGLATLDADTLAFTQQGTDFIHYPEPGAEAASAFFFEPPTHGLLVALDDEPGSRSIDGLLSSMDSLTAPRGEPGSQGTGHENGRTDADARQSDAPLAAEAVILPVEFTGYDADAALMLMARTETL